jgi:hypothetical protein
MPFHLWARKTASDSDTPASPPARTSPAVALCRTGPAERGTAHKRSRRQSRGPDAGEVRVRHRQSAEQEPRSPGHDHRAPVSRVRRRPTLRPTSATSRPAPS